MFSRQIDLNYVTFLCQKCKGHLTYLTIIGRESNRGVKNFFAHSPSRTSGWKKTLALMTFSLALVYGTNFCHYVDSLHHYVNVSYLFIKLEPIKQIKRFESCLFYLNSNTNTSSIKTKDFKQLKTNTLLLRRHHYLQRIRLLKNFQRLPN